MTVYIEDKLVITTLPKTIRFDLSKDFAKNVKHETDSTIEYNEFLTKHTINNKIRQLLLKYNHGNDIHEHEKKYNN